MEKGQRGCRGRAGRAVAGPAWPPPPGLNPPLWPGRGCRGLGHARGPPSTTPWMQGCRRGCFGSRAQREWGAVTPMASATGSRGPSTLGWHRVGAGWSQAAGTLGQRASGTPAGQLPTHAHAEPQLPLAPAGMVSGPLAKRRGLPATHTPEGPGAGKLSLEPTCTVPAAGSSLEPGQTWPCQGWCGSPQLPELGGHCLQRQGSPR